jgi:hypothetical protein
VWHVLQRQSFFWPPALALASGTAGERAHRAARPRRRAALSAGILARAGVVLLRGWLHLWDQPDAISA